MKKKTKRTKTTKTLRRDSPFSFWGDLLVFDPAVVGNLSNNDALTLLELVGHRLEDGKPVLLACDFELEKYSKPKDSLSLLTLIEGACYEMGLVLLIRKTGEVKAPIALRAMRVPLGWAHPVIDLDSIR